MKSFKSTLAASLIGSAAGIGAWLFGLGDVIWPAHPQMAIFVLTIAVTVVMMKLWPVAGQKRA